MFSCCSATVQLLFSCCCGILSELLQLISSLGLVRYVFESITVQGLEKDAELSFFVQYRSMSLTHTLTDCGLLLISGTENHLEQREELIAQISKN